MAFPTIQSLVNKRLPFLSASDEEKITETKEEVFYDYFAIQLKKDESLLSDENNFSFEERFFWADMTAYKLLQRRILQNREGFEGEGTSLPIKKAKADVVEVEYGNATNLQLDTNSIKSELELEICKRANELGLSVSFCDCISEPITYRIYSDC